MCSCVSQLRAYLHVCVYKGLSHPTILSSATTHTDRCEDWREPEPRLWSTASLSKYYSLSLSLPFSNLCLPLLLPRSMSACLPLGLAVLSLPHCAKHRAPLCYSEKEMQVEPNPPCFQSNIILPLFVTASKNINLTLGNKWGSDKIELLMSWMSDFQCI